MPCLQEYGNIGYHSTRNQNLPLDPTASLDEFGSSGIRKTKDILNKKNEHNKPVVPIISIDLPDQKYIKFVRKLVIKKNKKIKH